MLGLGSNLPTMWENLDSISSTTNSKNMPANKQKITTHMRVLFLKRVIIQITFKGNTMIV